MSSKANRSSKREKNRLKNIESKWINSWDSVNIGKSIKPSTGVPFTVPNKREEVLNG